jgi:AraC-like DNA-binding protein
MHTSGSFLHQTPNTVRYVGIHRAAAGQDHPFHRDQFWELMYLRTGHIICQQGEKRHPMHPGTAILHPPGILHADFATTAYTTYYLWIDAPTRTAWPCLYHDDERQSLEQICATVIQEWEEIKPEREAMLALLAEQIALLLRRATDKDEQSPGEAILAAADQVMKDHYRESLTVREIAHSIGVSVSSLHSHFAHLRGQTPMQALQAVRLRHALAQLHHSTLTLDVIAGLCGFHSASHLSRHVKAATGVSPGHLRPHAR